MSIPLAVLEDIIDACGAAPRIEALLPAGVRHRQLTARTLLTGMMLTLADDRPAHLTRVHAALTTLPADDQARLGIVEDWKTGPHQLTCRQTERTFSLVAEALAKEHPDGAPSDDLASVCDDLLEASIPAACKDASSSLAADWTDAESWSRPPRHGSGARKQLAARLFLTRDDLPPLLILMVALTGRNGETVKELSAAHRLLDGKAVEVTVIKRRRRPGHWIGQAVWETGPPSRRLHTPGGCYLLIWELTKRGREITSSTSLWSVWRNGHNGVTGTAEHHDPFAGRLGDLQPLNAWARRHHLLGDDGNLLSVRLGRLRTSAEVRRTRQLGGHLPSAARTNTMQVLWGSYLRADPTVTAWAEETMTKALGDAEQAALDAHAQALASHGGTLLFIPGPPPAPGTSTAATARLDAETARQAAAGELDTAWAACTGREASPWNSGTCRASFLDCFHCGTA